MKKKFLAGFLAATLAMAPMTSAFLPADVHAAEPAAVVTAETKGDKVVIGNEYMEREFSIAGDKLSTTRIVNKRTGSQPTTFTPAAGSEEFVVRVAKEGEGGAITLDPAIDRNGWTATADSRQNASGDSDGPGQNLLDGKPGSIWHSNYGGGIGDQNYPHNVVIDMKKDVTFQCFSYLPRQEGESVNGNIKEYKLYMSKESKTLQPDDPSWQLISEGTFKYDGVNPIYVNLDTAKTARQLRFEAVSSKNGEKFAGGAEFNLHADKHVFATSNDREFKASQLKLVKAPVIKDAKAGGKHVVFDFEPFEFKGVNYTISENIVMNDGDHFMRKFLEISVPEEKRADAVIDFIDLESLKVNDSDATWTIPLGKGGVVQMDEFKANLGQPIYIQGMFFGCEFPAADTHIEDQIGRMRYFSGKSFERLQNEKELTTDGKYVTWQTVAGAARSTEYQVVQADFFKYIESIATPSDFRIQYNSWFDNMMRIDDQNILDSFIEVDRELNKVETRPLDSYVVDDGWNNYNPTEQSVDVQRSGTGRNKTGFWEFNSKFPQGLTPSSDLVHNFGSNFGIWVGPRGGYNFYGQLGDIVTASGKGSKAGGSVDVADRTYVENFSKMANKFQDDYGVNYWKWDGFADAGQYGSFPAKDGVPGYANRHMTGGAHNMYHVTDLWEGWIDLMDSARKNAEDNKIPKLWISLTCYVNPSPWYLQWANSVWLQCVHDQCDASFGTTKMNKQITYRDSCYYDFIKNHEFQFPLANIYNHDPVYGKEGTGMDINTATDEDFKNYLYMLSTRGTAFWELYYSDSLMTDGKYEITSEFLKWAEENFHMLRNSKMIGGAPDSVKLSAPASGKTPPEAYGFSCFDGKDGILSMRNPSATENKTITFKFDRTIGVEDNAGTLKYHVEHAYNTPKDMATTGSLVYGKDYSFELRPNEVRILRISQAGDTTAPKYTRAYTDGAQTIVVKFDEKVTGKTFEVKGTSGTKAVTVEKSADGVTYKLNLTEPLTDKEVLEVTAKDVKDLAGNDLADKTISTVFYTNNLAAEVAEKELTGSENTEAVDLSNDGFAVNAFVTTTQAGSLVSQGTDYDLGIQEDGKAYFTFGGVKAVSKTAVKDGMKHMITGVKENNGILKIYIDGKLEGSAYDPANQYRNIAPAPVKVGNDTFAGTLGAAVYAAGLGYNEVADLKAPMPERTPIPTEGMTVTTTGDGETSQPGLPGCIFDDDPTTFWTSTKADAGIKKAAPAVTIDLGKVYKVDGFDYTKRYFDGPANQWKCTGNLRSYFLEVSTDNKTWTTVSEGPTFDDEAYTTKADGGTTRMVFNPVDARYVRISGGSSYHHEKQNVDKFMAIGDVKIYGQSNDPVNVAAEKNTLAKWAKDGSDAGKNTQRPTSMAVDKAKNDSAFYGEFGADGKDESAYLQVDLGEKYDIDSINMYRYWADKRTYKGTVIAVSDTADFAHSTVIYNSDKEDFHKLGAGKDDTYQETEKGKNFKAPAGTAGRYVRVYMHGSDKGTTNHIVELEVMGTKSTAPAPEIDYSALQKRLDDLNKIDKSNKTTDSVKAFNDLLKPALDLIANKAETQQQVTDMINALKDAEKLLVNRGDVTALSALADECKALKESDYTADSYAPFKAALDAANAIVADNSNSTQKDVDDAKKALEDAKKALVEAPAPETADKKDLQKAIADAKAKQEADYTVTSYNELKEKLAAAEAVNADDAATQKEINDAAAALNAAITDLVERGDVTALQELVDACKALDAAAYTSESFAALNEKLAAAEAILADSSDLSQAEVDQAVNALQAAKDALKAAVNKEELQALYDQNAAKENDGYTEESWKNFTTALEAAKTILDNKEATQEQVDAAKAQLETAAAGLEKAPIVVPVDKTSLNNLYAEAEAVKNDNYTEESWTAFQNAMKAAKTVLEDKEATQEQVDAAKAQLASAKEGLKKKADPTPGPTAEPTAVPTAEPTPGPTVEPTQKPVVPTQKPVEPTQKPVVPTQKPVVPTQKPVVPTQKPVVPTQKPVVPTQRPVITTTPQRPVKPGNGVKTGDESNIWMWFSVMAVAGCGIVLGKKKKETR